ncbi:hypothetical protein ACRAWD_18350 [Caulobacter segnis]
MTEKLKATVGVRQVRATSQYTLDEGGWLADGGTTTRGTRSTPLTPKFALTYEASDQVSPYANARQGLPPGRPEQRPDLVLRGRRQGAGSGGRQELPAPTRCGAEGEAPRRACLAAG